MIWLLGASGFMCLRETMVLGAESNFEDDAHLLKDPDEAYVTERS